VEKLEYRSGARTIDAWLTLPPGFDPAKRYPLLAGMGDSPARMCSPGFSLRSQVLAASGMIVLCANARGTPGYGESFANLIRTGIPGDAFQDWLAGIEAVAAKPYIDASRISVAGGLVAAWAIGHTDRFHAAVLRRPVADFTLDVATRADGAQRAAAWLGAMPWADPDQYWKNSPLYAAAAFRTPTLIIAADHDPAADELAFALRMRRVESALVRIGDERPGDLALEWDALLAWVNR
jgi:dipeptidyl aminopeptidase/acylaminoacyl peptidase